MYVSVCLYLRIVYNRIRRAWFLVSVISVNRNFVIPFTVLVPRRFSNLSSYVM